ncbi:AzlD domain-containing protein [Apirhabdus apintestini]|uniref:AzlD domain-containing protein n=1 Tax=Erwinia sp. HR93 TaxID=3094840 RepID=UPI002ADEC37C|nr:AzlD domain-containing protein [Erwinia sp. HR93]MEA1063960.1 AzlD domain-containing protein [Erwinia sp. HR93]WPM84400.1 AzlD domain-containing protein [Enterobacteriaceae bacterium CA-0114]
MTSVPVVIGGIIMLSVGTWLMRFAGARLGNRLPLTERHKMLLNDAATTLLFSAALAATFYEDTHFSGVARVAGVLVGIVLAWRKAPLMVVLVCAALVTAGLRFAGVT